MKDRGELKRLPVKYIRDKIKKDYKAKDLCAICDATEDLELHHLYSVSELLRTYCIKNGINLDKVITVSEMEDLRKKFAETYAKELSHENLYTLCATHHKKLHSVYGKTYSTAMAPKILNWLGIQREKCSKQSVNGSLKS